MKAAITPGYRTTVNILNLVSRGRTAQGWEAVLLNERTIKTCGHLHPDRAGAEWCSAFSVDRGLAQSSRGEIGPALSV